MNVTIVYNYYFKPFNLHILLEIIKLRILPQARMIRAKRWLLPTPSTHFMHFFTISMK